jgi:hypothetical protein
MLWNVWGGADIRCVQKEVERGSAGHKALSAGYGQVQSPDVHEGGGGADARCAREVESASHTPEGVGTLTCARGGCGRGVESARPDVRVNAGCEVSRDKGKYGWGEYIPYLLHPVLSVPLILASQWSALSLPRCHVIIFATSWSASPQPWPSQLLLLLLLSATAGSGREVEVEVEVEGCGRGTPSLGVRNSLSNSNSACPSGTTQNGIMRFFGHIWSTTHLV